MLYSALDTFYLQPRQPRRWLRFITDSMTRKETTDKRVQEAKRSMQRTWLLWGIGPLAAAAILMLAVSAVWASPAQVDEHTLERGFHGVLAICAALFLAALWLDGRWTSSEELAVRIWIAAGGRRFTPSRSQLAAHSDIGFKSIATSAKMLTAIGGAIATAAVISVWAGLSVAQGTQLILLGLAYQVFVFSRHSYYEDVLSAAVHGELVIPEDDSDN